MISFVIPCHNEEKNVSLLIPKLRGLIKQKKWDAEIIAVDDNSIDRTGEALDRLAKSYKMRVIHRKGERGMGISLIEGTKKAKGDVVLWTMGDFSDDFSTYETLIKRIRNNDLVIASRYMKGGSSGNNRKFKAFVSWLFPRLLRARYGFKVNDATNAFRIFRKSVFRSLYLKSHDFAISPEFTIKAFKAGYRISEVPTTYSRRKFGQTKLKLFRTGIRYLKLLRD